MIDSAAVIGCGSIGRRHLQNLQRLGVNRLFAVDEDPTRLEGLSSHVSAHASMDDVLSRRPQAVVVAVPPHKHVSIARAAIAGGADVFVEKPISNTFDSVETLIREAETSGRVVAVGYNLRFHSGLRRLKSLLEEGAIGAPLVIRAEFGQYLPDWRPAQDYRRGYNARRETGGGILLDASHELDYVIWIGGPVSTVFCAATRLSRLEIDVEDTAAITARLRNGAIAEIHVDSIQRKYARTCKVIGDRGTLVWDYEVGVTCFRADAQPERFAITPEANEMYVAEMRHFLSCVRRDESPVVDARAGAEVLRVTLAAHRSAETGCVVTV